jgi:hypothetical protein
MKRRRRTDDQPNKHTGCSTFTRGASVSNFSAEAIQPQNSDRFGEYLPLPDSRYSWRVTYEFESLQQKGSRV